MKKRVIFLLAVCVSLCCGSALALSFSRSDANIQKLRGYVKKVTAYSLYEAKYFHADTLAKYKRLGKSLPKFERQLDMITTYDRAGRKTSEYDAIMERNQVYEYDAPTHMLYSKAVTDGKYSNRIYTIDIASDGLPRKGVAVGKDGSAIFIEDYTTTRLENGNTLLCINHISANGKVTESEMELRPDMTMRVLNRKGTFTFDEQERPVEFISEDGSQHLIMEYLTDNQKIYRITSDGKKSIFKTITEDAYGNPLVECTYMPNGSQHSVSYEYQYDSQGNWIRQTKTEGTKKVYSERVIEYYK